MKKILLFICFMLLPLAAFSQSQVTVTGSVSGATSGAILFNLSPWSSSIQYYVSNVTTIANQTQICGIDGSGNVKNVLLSGPCLVWGNDVITPGNTTYTVVFQPAGRTTNTVAREQVVGSSYNLNTPVFGPAVTIVPQFQTITTSPISVNLVPAASHVFTVGNAGFTYAAGYFDQVFVGGTSVLNPVNFTVTNLTAGSINNREYCLGSGTFAVQVNAAQALLPATGGVVDCSNLQGVQPTSPGVTLGSSSKPVQLVLGPGVTITLSTNLIAAGSSSIIGSGTSTVIQVLNSTNPSQELVRLQGDGSWISHVRLHGSGQGDGSVVGQRGIWIGCGTNQSVICIEQDARVEEVEVDNFMGNGIAGDFIHVNILNSYIHHNTDANIFLQTTCNENTIQGNYLYNSRYNGVDNNGSNNLITRNHIYSNGGGGTSSVDWNGIVVSYQSGAAGQQPNANNITISDNDIHDNQGCGILVTGLATTPGIVNAPYGTTITGNKVYNHTTLIGFPSGTVHNQFFGGICGEGFNNLTVSSNNSHDNVFNYIMAGGSVNSNGLVMTHNQSENAVIVPEILTPSGVGYYFPGGPRLDGGGAAVDNAIVDGNIDTRSQGDAFRVALDGASGGVLWHSFTLRDNHSYYAGAYGYDLDSPNNFATSLFDESNLAVNATSGAQHGWVRIGLDANVSTPSIANGKMFVTQNGSPTTVSAFTGGTFGQRFNVLVNDNNTTYDFTSSSLKGNSNNDFVAYTGDFLDCTYDLSSSYCIVSPSSISGGFTNGGGGNVVQVGAKTAGVTANVVHGQITTDSQQLNGDATTSFLLSDNKILSANSTLVVSHVAGGTQGQYDIGYNIPAPGSARIFIHNNVTGSNLSEAIVIQFDVLRSVQ